jgi:hypothetical protein
MVDETPELGWQTTLDEAIRSTVADGEMVIRWFSIVEVMDTNGDRGMWTLGSPNSEPWDVLGMLNYARIRQETIVTLADTYEED